MQFIRDDGFIIKRRNFGEADRILTIFSKQNGKITVLAKGVRKITSRRGALLEPFNHVKFHTVQSYTRRVLTEVELIRSFDEYKNNLEPYQKILIACELLDALCGEDQLLSSLYEKVLLFAYRDKSEKSLHDFKMDLLVNLGYWNNDKKFIDDNHSYSYIESIIERKLKSRSFSF